MFWYQNELILLYSQVFKDHFIKFKHCFFKFKEFSRRKSFPRSFQGPSSFSRSIPGPCEPCQGPTILCTRCSTWQLLMSALILSRNNKVLSLNTRVSSTVLYRKMRLLSCERLITCNFERYYRYTYYLILDKIIQLISGTYRCPSTARFLGGIHQPLAIDCPSWWWVKYLISLWPSDPTIRLEVS